MKNTSVIAVIVVMLAAIFTVCGCSACSREMMYESSALPEKEVEQSAADILPEEEPDEEVFEPEEDIEVEEELPPLAMEADFEEIAGFDSESVLWGPGTFKDELGRSTACVDLQEKYGDFNAYFINFTKFIVIFFNASTFFVKIIVKSSQISAISMSFSEKHLYLLLCTF